MFAFIFLSMLFAHIVDDYYLQGVLANMKQKKWWREQTDNEKYKNDWIAALVAHGLSWSFMIMLPCNIYLLTNNSERMYWIVPTFLINAWWHCSIDHLKCNKFQINLITDQILHLKQIVLTFIAFLACALK